MILPVDVWHKLAATYVNTSSRVITQVKHLEPNQFSDGANLLGSGKCCCRKVGNIDCPFEILFPLCRLHLVHHWATLKNKNKYGTNYD